MRTCGRMKVKGKHSCWEVGGLACRERADPEGVPGEKEGEVLFVLQAEQKLPPSQSVSFLGPGG